MKKKFITRVCTRLLPKIDLKMKLTTLLLIISLFKVEANTYSQVTKISLELENVSLEEAFKQIESISEFRFVYESNLLDLNRLVTLNFKNKKIARILSSLFKDSDINYELYDRLILLTKKAVNNVEPTKDIVQYQITGTITDTGGVPLPGATILEKGTNNGTQSDFDGKFALNVSSGTAVIVVSYIGFASKEVTLNNESNITVALQESASELDEVVVVGYGTQKKINLTGAVESVELESIESRPLTNTSAALQGLVAGAFISQTSGQPGSDDAKILIRGVSTFGNSDPLIIIDGMIGSLDDVNPNDLESVSVLKDAASSAIYGNRAANGVIVITTKKGKTGQMKVNYKGYYGVQEVTEIPKLLKGVEYLELRAQAQANSNGGIFPSWYTDEYMNLFRNNVDPILYPTDYDWVSDVFQTATIIDNHINISGGSEAFQYSAAIGYLDQDGIADGSKTKKLTFRTNFTSSFLDNRLKVDLNFSGYDQRTGDLPDGGIDSAMYFIYVAPSTSRRYLPGVGYNAYGDKWAKAAIGGYTNTNTSPINVRMAATLNIMEGLSAKASYNLYRTSRLFESWNPSVTLFGFLPNGELNPQTPTVSSLLTQNETSLTRLFNAQLNYSKELVKDLNMDVMVAYEARDYVYDWKSASRENFSANLPNLSVGDASTQKNSGRAYDGAWLSYFGRFGLNFKDKYLIEGVLRRDGSSRFLDKWGSFPSASIGWRISEEPFIKESNGLFNNLKLRVSWGKLGNESIGQYYAASDELSLNISHNFNNTLYPAGAVTKLANRGTTWETSEQLNFGLDFGILKNKISGTIEYFVKKNSDILMQLPLSSTLGLSTLPFQNAAAMENKGLEVLINYKGQIKDVKINANITASHTTNKITDLAGQDPIIFGDLIWKEGEAFNSFFAYKTEGLYQSQADIDSHLSSTSGNAYAGLVAQPGDIKFTDINEDGVINADDKTLIGKPYPDWIYSANLGFEWKSFDLNLFFQGVSGVNSLNQGMVTAPFHGGSAGTGEWYRNAWTPENPNTNVQRLYSEPNRFDIVSDYYLEDASYLRLKNITVGYKIPKKILDVLSLSHARVYGNIQNAFTWTKMRYGFDPEKPSTTTNTLQHPQSRIYSIGLNLNF